MLWQLVDSPPLDTQPGARHWRGRLGVAGPAEACAIAARLAIGVLARLRPQPDHFDPDPYATEAPFLSDRWPGH
jgi:hypothetical protein